MTIAKSGAEQSGEQTTADPSRCWLCGAVCSAKVCDDQSACFARQVAPPGAEPLPTTRLSSLVDREDFNVTVDGRAWVITTLDYAFGRDLLVTDLDAEEQPTVFVPRSSLPQEATLADVVRVAAEMIVAHPPGRGACDPESPCASCATAYGRLLSDDGKSDTLDDLSTSDLVGALARRWCGEHPALASLLVVAQDDGQRAAALRGAVDVAREEAEQSGDVDSAEAMREVWRAIERRGVEQARKLGPHAADDIDF